MRSRCRQRGEQLGGACPCELRDLRNVVVEGGVEELRTAGEPLPATTSCDAAANARRRNQLGAGGAGRRPPCAGTPGPDKRLEGVAAVEVLAVQPRHEPARARDDDDGRRGDLLSLGVWRTGRGMSWTVSRDSDL
jgi:hypothetical protein